MKLFNEQQVKELAESVLSNLREKIKDDIAESFYDRISDYLYEHYDNIKDKIENELIKEITEKFIEDPTAYKFSDLRAKLFQENKDKIITVLTDEVIESGMKNILFKRIDKDYYWNWEWKDGIAKMISEHWDLFERDKRINEQIVREIKNRDDSIERLKERLKEYERSND